MKWPEKFRDIVKYKSELIVNYNLNESTYVFLTEVGLPKDAPPFLSFVKNNKVPNEGILRFTVFYKARFKLKFKKYIVIGSNGAGDPIVIDTKDNCRIKQLNHEDNFSEIIINNTITDFAKSLIAYQDFIKSAIYEFGEDAWLDSLYSKKQIDQLEERLNEIDTESVLKGRFWFYEVDLLKINKENNE
ncbi:MAG: hypothetical protein N4A71_25330 [Carboxylicivirga sp.]|jgi:hypothetical protein|nr:hypothetical protein [Carboxylicivirga sp.]MCT4645187.1 hypothetical protein [Carboxylicivirga sp.]